MEGRRWLGSVDDVNDDDDDSTYVYATTGCEIKRKSPQKRPPLASFISTLEPIFIFPPQPLHRPIQHIMLHNKHPIKKQTDTCQAEFAWIVRQRACHSCPTTTIATGSVRIEQQLHQAENPSCSVEEDLGDGEAEGGERAGVREGLRDVFGDCEEDFGEGEGCDLVDGLSDGLRSRKGHGDDDSMRGDVQHPAIASRDSHLGQSRRQIPTRL